MRRMAWLFPVLLMIPGATRAAQVEGTWTAQTESEHPGKLYLSLEVGRHDQHGSIFDPSVFRGLTATQIASSTSTPVHFTLEREAGTFTFDGSFHGGRGGGDFAFAPSPDQWKRLLALGVRATGMSGDDDHKLFELAVVDVTTDFIRSMQAIGYDVALEKVIEFRIFDIDPTYVRDMKAVGFDHLSADKLVETRIHGATPDYIRSMRAAGNDLTIDGYIESRIFQITPEFAAELKRAGYPNLDRGTLTQFKIHGVTIDYIDALEKAGYAHVPAQKLIEMRIFNVTPEFIRRANQAADRTLPVDKLVEMKIFHVEPEMARKDGGDFH